MNPITNMKNLNKMNDRELEMGVAGTKSSWHMEYRDSAWIFAGGLPYELTEGDVICVFSQYGEIVHVNLVRDLGTGKSKGFAFLCYQDQRSTILAVDNLNGMKVLGRLVRIDHVHTYKLPKDLEKLDEERRKLFLEGCAPKPLQQEAVPDVDSEPKKRKKKKKKRKQSSSDSGESETQASNSRLKSVKNEPEDYPRRHRSGSRNGDDGRDRSRYKGSKSKPGAEKKRRTHSTSDPSWGRSVEVKKEPKDLPQSGHEKGHRMNDQSRPRPIKKEKRSSSMSSTDSSGKCGGISHHLRLPVKIERVEVCHEVRNSSYGRKGHRKVNNHSNHMRSRSPSTSRFQRKRTMRAKPRLSSASSFDDDDEKPSKSTNVAAKNVRNMSGKKERRGRSPSSASSFGSDEAGKSMSAHVKKRELDSYHSRKSTQSTGWKRSRTARRSSSSDSTKRREKKEPRYSRRHSPDSGRRRRDDSWRRQRSGSMSPRRDRK